MIKFNFIENVKICKAGEPCKIIELDNFDVASCAGKSKDNLPALQIFTTGYRVNNNNCDISKWNGCVVVDVDSKKYNKIAKINIGALEQNLAIILSENYSENFYLLQRSASGTSFHIIFYFECERTFENHNKCANYAMETVKEAFLELGLEEMINAKDVLDDCSKVKVQPMFISSFQLVFNTLCSPTGKIDVDVLEEYNTYKEFTPSEVVFKGTNLKIAQKLNDNICDWHNTSRRRLISILAEYYKGDYDATEFTYRKVIEQVKDKISNHSVDDVMGYFKRDFLNIYNAHYKLQNRMLDFCKKNLGLKFKIEKKFEPKIKDDIEFNETLDLGTKTLSEKIFDIYNNSHNLIHITAGCGFGKTYAAKSLTKLSMLNNDIDMLFSGLTKFNIRICFVTPMTSINRGNFENLSDWVIIDGEHPDTSKGDLVKYSGKSICTTWTSYLSYQMDREKFDLYIFDEVHSFYLYNYRTEIKDIKRTINEIAGRQQKVILMTGTPSYELKEFDCYKIKVTKETQQVKVDVVFYNEQFNGYVFNDVKKWIGENMNNAAVIFADKANEGMKDRIETYYGIKIDMVYNKKFVDDVKYMTEHENFDGQVLLCSVYAQAGINLKLNKNVRIYILNDCGMSVIQYANRIRNKECIDKIIVPYKIANIENIFPEFNDNITYDDVLKRIDKKNEFNLDDGSDDDIFRTKRKSIINLNFGLNSYYVDKFNNKYVLDEEAYRDYELINRTVDYERNTQILYNRLIEANFDVNFVYLEDDVVDEADRTRNLLKRFAGHMQNFNFECVKINKDDEIYLDTKNFELHKSISDNDKENIEYILNYLKRTNDGEYEEKFEELIDFCFSANGTVTKTDVKYIKKCFELNTNMENYNDTYFLNELMTNDDVNLISLSAMYASLICPELPEPLIVNRVADEIYNTLSEYKKLIDKYKWLVEKVNEGNINYVKRNADIEMRKDVYMMVFSHLLEKHKKGNKENKDKKKKIEINGVIYDSVKECCEKTGKSKVTIIKWLKEGKYDSKYI